MLLFNINMCDLICAAGTGRVMFLSFRIQRFVTLNDVILVATTYTFK